MNLLSFISLLLISLYVGFFIKTRFSIRIFQSSAKFLNFSESFFIGNIVIIAFVSIFLTKGFTLNILSLVFIICLIIKSKDTNEKNQGFKIRDLIFLISIGLIFYAIHYFFFPNLIDIVYYSKLSQNLVKYKIENYNIQYFEYLSSKNKLTLYHYNELWLNGFISKIFNLNCVESYSLVITPYFHFISFLSILSILSIYIQSSIKLFFASMSIYGASILFFQILSISEGHDSYWYYGLPDITSVKSLSFIQPFVFLLFSIYNKEKFVLNLLLSLILIVCNLVFLPIIGLIILFLLIEKKKEIYCFINNNKRSFAVLITFIIILLIYSKSIMLKSVLFQKYIYSLDYYIEHIHEYIKIFGIYFTKIFLIYPFGILSFYYVFAGSNRIKLISRLYLFCIISLCIVLSFFYSMPDITQILSLPIQTLGVFYLVVIIIEFNNKFYEKFLLSLIMIVTVLNFSFETDRNYNSIVYKSNKISNLLANKNVGYISSKVWSKWTYNNNILALLYIQNENCNFPIDLSVCFTSIKECKKYSENNPDYPIKFNHENIEIQTKRFLNSKDIGYLWVENTFNMKRLKNYNMKFILQCNGLNLYRYNKN